MLRTHPQRLVCHSRDLRHALGAEDVGEGLQLCERGAPGQRRGASAAREEASPARAAWSQTHRGGAPDRPQEDGGRAEGGSEGSPSHAQVGRGAVSTWCTPRGGERSVHSGHSGRTWPRRSPHPSPRRPTGPCSGATRRSGRAAVARWGRCAGGRLPGALARWLAWRPLRAPCCARPCSAAPQAARTRRP